MRSIFITGAASGIGRETAHRFAGAGWRLGLCDRDAAALASVEAEVGVAASSHIADVRDAGALAAALAEFCGEDALGVLFNCAGILEMRDFAETPLDRLHALVDVNVKGVINGIHAALPYLRRAPDARIVTMSSASAVYGVPEEAVYSASKFAVRGLTEGLNIELERDGIWVCDVMVGYVATPMVTAAERQAKSVEIVGVNVKPAQVAETVFAAVEGRKVHWFVTEADAGSAQAFDATEWEQRRDLMKRAAGF
ncbi:SDR family oxidoreductase [Sphingomonas lycopersici]|uniref:SDR family oxidoreductase n=1 Tax=Sphingomonas lycopersici TaxID=2951807 RepID=A0AA42CPC8_9SPHN|nr:SDR family oxidoreductase [Sphingomonas lycopersici]MCW6534214.1 SDR family oxidoreductase [Sphingomonas lycopersici]